ncbi:hypothetical protein ACKI1J_34255 [Streptomyces scabiei]|uniref:hypothetical protein n=1 Tax=Streptomyces scabiei TaxID=1930 RepID=UPI0038F7B665
MTGGVALVTGEYAGRLFRPDPVRLRLPGKVTVPPAYLAALDGRIRAHTETARATGAHRAVLADALPDGVLPADPLSPPGPP